MTKHSDARIRGERDAIELANANGEVATRIAVALETVGMDRLTPWQRLDALSGMLAGTSYDGDGRGSTIIWCFEHSQEAIGRGGCGCDGIPIQVSDPTGEYALNGDDLAAKAQNVIRHQLEVVRDALADIESTLLEWQGRHAPTPVDLDATDGCFSCNRIGEHSKVHGSREVTPGEFKRLCHWCGWDWLPKYECLPPIDVIRAHHDGGRLYVRDDGTVIHQGHPIAKLDNIRAGQR